MQLLYLKKKTVCKIGQSGEYIARKSSHLIQAPGFCSSNGRL